MNFHISPFSPIRPQFSPTNHGVAARPSGPVKIEVEAADAPGNNDGLTSSGPDSDDDDGDDDVDSLSDVSADDVTQDSRDVLVQRLTDLAARLSRADVRASGVEALHRQVDEMEQVLRGGGSRDPSVGSRRSSRRSRGGPSVQPGASRPRSLQLPSGNGHGHGHRHGRSLGEPARGRDSLGVMAPMSPSWFMSRFQRRPSVHKEAEAAESAAGEAEGRAEVLPPRVHSKSDSTLQPQRPTAERLDSVDAGAGTPATRISSEVAEDVVKEAEKLCAEMAGVIESLQTRREESDHLQSVLIQREEMAHQRIHEKTVILGELEDVVADNEAELRHLKLELRAIEVQCMGYVPKGADPELTLSIRNWKEDWQVLREKWASRRGTSFVSGDEASTVSTLASLTSR